MKVTLPESTSQPAGYPCEQVGVDWLVQLPGVGAHRRTAGVAAQQVGEIGDPVDLDRTGHQPADLVQVRGVDLDVLAACDRQDGDLDVRQVWGAGRG